MAATTRDARTSAHRRARIEQTALELFRSRGFDAVTVEDLSAAAGVAPATFYRYFGTKEEVVFAYRGEFAAVLEDAIAELGQLPEAEVLPAVLLRFAEYLETQRELLAVRDDIVLGTPRLMQRTLTVQRDLESVLATGLARLRGLQEPDAAVLMEAGTGVVVLRVALRAWRAGGGSLVCATAQALAVLRGLLGRMADPPGVHPSR